MASSRNKIEAKPVAGEEVVVHRSRYYPVNSTLFWEHQRWCTNSWPAVGTGFMVFTLTMLLEQNIDLEGAITAFILAYGGMSVQAWYWMNQKVAEIRFHTYGLKVLSIWQVLRPQDQERLQSLTRYHIHPEKVELVLIGYVLTLHRRDWPELERIKEEVESSTLLNIIPETVTEEYRRSS